MSAAQHPRTFGTRRAFTLIDVVVTLAVVLMLVALFLPTLADLRAKSKTSVCADNMRLLTEAWRAYAHDNAGVMVNTLSAEPTGWVGAGTKPEANEAGLLWKYVKKQAPFLCPADPSKRRARTYSINYYLGTYGTYWLYPEYLLTKIADVPSPAKTIAFVDEDDPREYHMGGFAQHPPHSEKVDQWVDVPATWHTEGGNVSFVDGHVEYWPYRDKRTRDLKQIAEVQSPRNKDLVKMQHGLCNWPKPKKKK
jgi:prepilin-type processing-associated H-X9-DG protein